MEVDLVTVVRHNLTEHQVQMDLEAVVVVLDQVVLLEVLLLLVVMVVMV